MAYGNLNEFILALEKAGELKRIKEPLSPELEIAEVTDRVCKKQGPALLFENVVGHSMPVLMNMFGSERRMKMALGVDDYKEVSGHLLDFLEAEAPDTLFKKLKVIPKIRRLANIFPKTLKKGPCQEVIIKDSIDLRRFPVLKCWPQDAGRFITLPLVFTQDPRTGKRNVGMYRLQVFDASSTGMHWHTHKGGAQHYRIAEHLNQTLEVAVALGPDPATTYAATAPLPDDVDEMVFAGYLRREPVEMVRCITVDLEVPAHSQIVLEGHVFPGERSLEGPFGDHTGYYCPADHYPVFHLSCITHQCSPIYPATIVGRPPMEDCWMAKATERIFLPLIKRQLPEITDMNLPIEGVFHNLAFISIDKRYPGHAKKVMHAIWGLGQMMFTKIIVVFDREVDVQDLKAVLWRLGNNVDPRRDTVFVDGPVDVLNHAAPLPNLGSKMGIDATRKWPEEGFSRQWPEVIEMDPEVVAKIDTIWESLGLDNEA
ncbi:MAG: menaquinone biosynthesis decarboxylase [Syntrophobacteria bacterium]